MDQFTPTPSLCLGGEVISQSHQRVASSHSQALGQQDQAQVEPPHVC